jgi:hypothetical protein
LLEERILVSEPPRNPGQLEYAATADFETFLQRRGDAGIRNDIARLAGGRMVVSVEVEDGKRLAEGAVFLSS